MGTSHPSWLRRAILRVTWKVKTFASTMLCSLIRKRKKEMKIFEEQRFSPQFTFLSSPMRWKSLQRCLYCRSQHSLGPRQASWLLLMGTVYAARLITLGYSCQLDLANSLPAKAGSPPGEGPKFIWTAWTYLSFPCHGLLEVFVICIPLASGI